MYTLTDKLMAAVDKFKDNEAGPLKKKKHFQYEKIVITVHKYIKLLVALEMTEKEKGLHVFPRTSFGTSYRNVVLKSDTGVMEINYFAE